jgi:hypothetical protein
VLAVGHSTDIVSNRLPGTFLVANRGMSANEIGVAGVGVGDGEGVGDGLGVGEGVGDGVGDGVGEAVTHSLGKNLQ